MVFLRYFMAGGMATAVHYAVLLALVELVGIPAASSTVVGALCGAVAAYAINRSITFTSSKATHQQALPRFMLIAAAGAAMNGALVWSGVHWLGWHYLVAQALATVLVLGLTYRLNRSWTFAR
jgi:putative flippase GtrA